jgi:hypothetical protein
MKIPRAALWTVLGVGACGSAAAAVAMVASEVGYSNQSTSLKAHTVQAAIDELAVRQETETPVGKRLVYVTTTIDNKREERFSGEASCPDPAHDLPLGGSCSAGPRVRLGASYLLKDPDEKGVPRAKYACDFDQDVSSLPNSLDAGVAADGGVMPMEQPFLPGQVTVVCLRNGR